MHTFFGWGEVFAGRMFHEDCFPWGGKLSRSEFFRKNLTLWEFARIPIRNSSYVLLSLCQLNLTSGDVKGNCPE